MSIESIFRCDFTSGQAKVLQRLQAKLAGIFGVTLQGNRLTLRWGDPMVDVHMIIESVTTAESAQELLAQHKRWEKLYEKYHDLAEEIFYAETGEHSK